MGKGCGRYTQIRRTASWESLLYLPISIYLDGVFFISLWKRGKLPPRKTVGFWSYIQIKFPREGRICSTLFSSPVFFAQHYSHLHLVGWLLSFLVLQTSRILAFSFPLPSESCETKGGKEMNIKKDKFFQKSFTLKNQSAKGREESKILTQKPL